MTPKPSPKQYSCFVISPIGAEDSETRRHANDFLELLIEPALQKYNFSVTRADRIATPSVITTEIVRLVQESDLCIIDLTSNNPNVFYECGRRHETGLPFIQMIAKGNESQLPFDVAGIRTVMYDLGTPRSILESTRKLQEFIDGLLASGFASATGGETMSSIAQAIERVERKVNQLISGANPAAAGSTSQSPVSDIEDLMKGPLEAFESALRKGNLDGAFSKLDRLKKILPTTEFVTAVVMLTTMGHGRSFELLESILNDIIKNTADMKDRRDEMAQHIMQSLKKYFENVGELAQGTKHLEEVCSRIELADQPFSSRTRAFICNQVGMAAYLIRQFDVCIKYTKMAIALAPEESAYQMNLAMALQDAGRAEDAEEALARLAEMKDLSTAARAFLNRSLSRQA